MNRRTFVQRTAVTAAGLGFLRNVQACAPPAPPAPPRPAIIPGTFAELRDRYFVYNLEKNPVTSTYLGGDAYNPALADSSSKLRDYRPQALAAESLFYRSLFASVQAVTPETLTPREQADLRLMLAQLAFLIHQHDDLHYHQRSLDTYVAEPFRGVDWQIQGMRDAGGGLIGDELEWQQLVTRTMSIPGYLEVARANLLAGKAAGRIPDRRMVQRDGIEGSRANARYFRTTLARTAQPLLGTRPFAHAMQNQVVGAGLTAAAAWDQFAEFVTQTFDASETVDRYAIGEAEYEWRLKNVLQDQRSAAELYEYGAAQVALYTSRIIGVAREFSDNAKLNLPFGSEAESFSSVNRVMEFLGRDAPRDDEQLLRWYREAGQRGVAYGREHQLFEVPPNYRLEVVPTPPVLRSTIDAAYYPAPPLKRSGSGRFYLTPTGDDPAALRQNNFASVATTAVHEGFPGHDWHYRYMTVNADGISNIRWLTPGAVEDSSSMWSDSMAVEGWALYAEELMAEPVQNRKYGFYSPGEYLYVLQAQLLRAVRVRVDAGLHTNRMTFDEAVDYFVARALFEPGARQRASADSSARAAFDSATRAIYRYSKWPTQAITYNLGKNTIVELKESCRTRGGGSFSARTFHERFMKEGPIPVAYIRESFIEGC